MGKTKYGRIFLGKDTATYGKEGTGFEEYDPDFECGGSPGTPGRDCPYTAKESESQPDVVWGGDGRKLHITIASHRDPLCPRTLFNFFTKAEFPDLLRIIVIQQNDPLLDKGCLEFYCAMMKSHKKYKDGEECPYANQVEIHAVHAREAKGPLWARGLSSKDLEKGYSEGRVSPQDFCLSTDSHMDVEPHWDRGMAEMWDLAGNEYAVLSTYVDSTEHLGEVRREVPHLCMVTFTSNVRTHATKSIHGLVKPKLTNVVWGAGLSYSKCHAELKVPVDTHAPHIFDGEEFNRAARFWTYGYDIYTPHKVYILHDYKNSQSNPISASWRRSYNVEDFNKANKRLLTMVDVPGGFTDQTQIQWLKRSKYGLGDRRTLDQLIAFSGHDLRHRRVTIDGKNRCGNLRWVHFEEHPKGVNYIPEFDKHENPVHVPDSTSVWYNDGPIDVSLWKLYLPLSPGEVRDPLQKILPPASSGEVPQPDDGDDDNQSADDENHNITKPEDNGEVPQPDDDNDVSESADDDNDDNESADDENDDNESADDDNHDITKPADNHDNKSSLFEPPPGVMKAAKKSSAFKSIIPKHFDKLRGGHIHRHLVPEQVRIHGLAKLPLPVRLAVFVLLAGLAVAIFLSKGTGVRAKGKRKKHNV